MPWPHLFFLRIAPPYIVIVGLFPPPPFPPFNAGFFQIYILSVLLNGFCSFFFYFILHSKRSNSSYFCDGSFIASNVWVVGHSLSFMLYSRGVGGPYFLDFELNFIKKKDVILLVSIIFMIFNI